MSSFAHSQATHSDLAWDFRFTRTLWIASYALLIYDYILTLSDEIAYMWGGNWTRAKALFLLVYFCFTFLLNSSGSLTWKFSDKVLDNCESATTCRWSVAYIRIHDPFPNHQATQRFCWTTLKSGYAFIPVQFLCFILTLGVDVSLCTAPTPTMQIAVIDSGYRCSFSYGWFVYTELITQTFGSIILILRVYAIYESNKPLLKALVALLVSVLLVQIIFSAILSDTTGMKLNQTLRTSGCIPNNWVYKPWVYWVPATTFDGLLFSLVVFKSIQYAWEQHTSALLFTMLRDSFLYFGSVFLIIVADLIVWTRSSEGLYVALPQMVPVLHSIMACRMLLNISQCTRPWLAEPWRDQDAAVFSAALRLMSLFKSPTGPIIPTVQLPESPVTEETCI
ncbi:hypothetical protein BC835DRAFT_1419603 [Cytidiella melzeri]|nr:hypothetical protein BC835DRAFT_1419603 [Cytidiella melzeri]